MLYQCFPLIAVISTFAAFISPAVAVTQLSSRATNFTFNLRLETDLRIKLKNWPSLPKAEEVAKKGIISGPIDVQLDGTQDADAKYMFTKWTDMPEGTYIDECTVWWDSNGPPGVASITLAPLQWKSNGVMTYSCVGIKLDPASGPYITIEPKDLEVDIIDPPMFGARRFGNGETATFKGVSYMKRDHIKIRLYSDIGVHECDFGTVDGRSQSTDITWKISPVGGGVGTPVIPDYQGIKDNVGLGCKKVG